MLRQLLIAESLLQWVTIVLQMGLFISRSVVMATDTLPLQFAGDKVIRVEVKDAKSFHHVEKLLESIIPQEKLDIWQYPDTRRQHLDVYIPHNYHSGVTQLLQNYRIHYDVLIGDVQHLIKGEVHSRVKRIKRDEDETANVIGRYARLSEIYSWLDLIVTNHPDLASTSYIGDSYEGLPMKVLKMGRPSGKQKWSIWVDGGIHAREFIAPHTVHYIIHQLLLGLEENDPEVVQFLDELDWYFLPVINVDGYEFSHTKNRMWRKNRHPYTVNCTGVDLNRNFDYKWGGVNSSPDPCSTMYRGPSPASEPETQNMENFLLPRKHLFKSFFSFHSYGMKWMSRWAYTKTEVPEDHEELLELAQRATNATNEVHGMSYEAGKSSEIMYPFAGGSADWARGVLGIKYPYLLELRDNGRYGFLLPENQSIPTGEEVWAGVKVVVREVIQKYANQNVPLPAEVPPLTNYPHGDGDHIFTTFPHEEGSNIAPTVTIINDTQLSVTSSASSTPGSVTSPPVLNLGESPNNGAARNVWANLYFLPLTICILFIYVYLFQRESQFQ